MGGCHKQRRTPGERHIYEKYISSEDITLKTLEMTSQFNIWLSCPTRLQR